MSRWQRIRATPARAARAIGRGLRFAVLGVVSAAVAFASLFDFRDLMLFGGSGLLGYGLYSIYPPAAFVVPGAIFVAVSVFGAK